MPSTAPELQQEALLNVESFGTGELLTRAEQLNDCIRTHNALMKEANRIFSKLDGRRRGTSTAAVVSQIFVASGGIASAALTAAAPQANAPWVQGFNAMGTGVNSVRSEFASQRLTADAYNQALSLMANDIMAAREKLDFAAAKAKIYSSNAREWAMLLTSVGAGVRDLENAVVLKPLTITVNVVRDTKTSKKVER